MKTKKLIFVVLFLVCAECVGKEDTMLDRLIPALIAVESDGNVDAVGDNGEAVGILQIHKCVVDDLNIWLAKDEPHYIYADRFDPHYSKLMCIRYLKHYSRQYERTTGKHATLEVLARIWNGGPNGWKKKSTEKYWLKVKKELVKVEQVK